MNLVNSVVFKISLGEINEHRQENQMNLGTGTPNGMERHLSYHRKPLSARPTDRNVGNLEILMKYHEVPII